MNEEQQQIIDEVYKRYRSQTIINSKDLKDFEELDGMDLGTGEWKKVHRQYAPKEFINKCKTDKEFSEKWGLKIEERELSLNERAKLLSIKVGWEIKETSLHGEGQFETEVTQDSNVFGIPTKLITITYNNETIESYE